MSGNMERAPAGWVIFACTVLLLCAAVAQAGRNRAILIGINDYGGSRLEYCVADAKALGEQLACGGEFEADDVIVMTDDAAENVNRPTSANITDRLENLAQLGELGTLLVFFAGHGVVGDDGGGYLLTLEGTVRRSIKLDDLKKWMGECKAKDRVLILDCCHAGKGMRDLTILPMARAAAAGMIVIASCGEKQGAFDDAARGHGAFTAALLDGLNGAADTDKDRRVTADELFRYAQSSVKAWVYNRFNKVQTPVMMPSDGGKAVSLGRPPRVVLPPPSVPRPGSALLAPVPTPALPLPPPAKTIEEWATRYGEASAALEKARDDYTPASAAVQSAERNLKAAKEGLRQAFLAEAAPNLKALKDRYAAMGREMRSTHPDMRKLAARIAVEQDRILELGPLCLSDEELGELGIERTRPLDCGGGAQMKLALIPKGEFMMGSENGADDEKPVHRVAILKPFYMGIHEVTQSQYQAVMGQNPSNFKGADLPVEQVSWNDAAEFCRKLSARTGKTVRLPTEAEWAYACRAGSISAYGYGDNEGTLGDYAWYGQNSGGKTHPVGEKKPNAWGIYDMHGNVWEWCQSLYKEYPYRAGDGREGIGDGLRVLRGGSWGSDPRYCRSAGRYWGVPAGRLIVNGFRVVCAP